MVLELILQPLRAEKQPIDMFVLGFSVASIALWLSVFIYRFLPDYIPKEHVSSWFLFLTSLSLIILLNRILLIEEDKETTLLKETLMQRHKEVIFMFIFLFFGLIFAYSFWFTILPEGWLIVIFGDQWNEILRIQGLRTSVVGSLLSLLSGYAVINANLVAKNLAFLKIIMLNNLRLLFLFIAFSFIFGAGAVLLLTWNAAVVGVAIGNLIRDTIVITAGIFDRTAIYFKTLPLSFFGFFTHGIFEILGYFVGAIAGGIFSAAITRKHYKSKYFRRIVMDVSLLILLAIALIVFGAFIEVYITPVL